MNRHTLIPHWLRHYQRHWLSADVLAGVIVTLMLIPQSLAYAVLAGLPPQVGLYASIAPLIIYAWLGSSMTLAVGPVAIVSLMTLNALAPLAAVGSDEYIHLAIMLALLSGALLFIFGTLRLGAVAHLLSHPVIGGFISGSAIVIVVGQIKPLLGLTFASSGHSVVALVQSLVQHAHTLHSTTALLGVGSLFVLLLSRVYLGGWLTRWGVPATLAQLFTRLSPIIVLIIACTVVAFNQWQRSGVTTVGIIPSGLPRLSAPWPQWQEIRHLAWPALLIGLVGFVESVSVAQSLAFQRQQKINPNRELVGLGAANLASALCGGYPVTGGFARSMVNFSAGARTPLSGVVSAVLMSVVLLGFTAWFAWLPHSVLAATIVAAVIQLIDFKPLIHNWRFDKADAWAYLVTFLGVLSLGVEQGIVLGVLWSLAAMVWHSAHPHMAVVGRVPNTQHFRNVARHHVHTHPELLAIRIDEHLYFGNAHAVESQLIHLLSTHPNTRTLLLILSAVNRIDSTALDMLLHLTRVLHRQQIELALAEVKGQIMDQLQRAPHSAPLLRHVYQSTHEAFVAHTHTV